MTGSEDSEGGGEGRPVGGVFPGGPSRSRATTGTAPEVRGGEFFEARADARGRKRRRGRRNRQQWGIALAVMLFAGIAGFLLGQAAEPPSAAERAAASQGLDPALKGELNRLMAELWKMESLELSPGVPR